MGEVPNWDGVHGWHEFKEGSWQGTDWCALCDCLRSDHKPKPEGDKLEHPEPKR